MAGNSNTALADLWEYSVQASVGIRSQELQGFRVIFWTPRQVCLRAPKLRQEELQMGPTNFWRFLVSQVNFSAQPLSKNLTWVVVKELTLSCNMGLL